MDWEIVRNSAFDVIIATCGYEERCSFIVNHKISSRTSSIVLDYECTGVLDYDRSKVIFEQAGGLFTSISDPNFRIRLAERLCSVEASLDVPRPLLILLDVSSCSRSVLARVLLTISESLTCEPSVTCVYALSQFEDPPSGELPSTVSEPVIGDLSGWSDDLSKPPCAVISLGFEPGRALGTIDYLEVPEIRLFMPRGTDVRFEHAVRGANEFLIAEAGTEFLFTYDVMQPNSTYLKLESLIFGLLPSFRPVIIPLGPKIFSAIAMVLAIRMFPTICVWRTSSGSGADIVNRRASGEVAVFDAPPIKRSIGLTFSPGLF